MSYSRFPMEMHLVHRNSKYPDLKSATGEMDGIAVFAALFEVEPYGDEHGRDWVRGFRSLICLVNMSMSTAIGSRSSTLCSILLSHM